jgi:CRP/FNR family cyclic AMP-dependent transcriptional regulator
MAPLAARSVSIEAPRIRAKTPLVSPAFDVKSFLDSVGLGRNVHGFRAKEIIVTQGDPAKNVMYIQEGGVRLTVVNTTGKEAVLAILGPGDFFGEQCIAGQAIRMASATAIGPTTVLVIAKGEMVRLLHRRQEFSDLFISDMLTRNIRAEEDLVDQLFNSSEKRLARTLLLLARYGNLDEPEKVFPKLSQETLAEMIGTTRSRVNFFMNKFRRLGFIQYRGGDVHINEVLLKIVLHD